MEDNEEGSNPGTAVGMPDKGISGAVASGNVELSMANALTMQLPEVSAIKMKLMLQIMSCKAASF